MKKVLLLAASICTIAFGSCTKNTNVSTENKEGATKVTFSPIVNGVTRVVSDIFEENDKIYVTALDMDNNTFASNVSYLYSDGIFDSSSPIIYSSDDQELKYRAVYPAVSGFAEQFTFSANSNQSVSDNYEMSDLLISRTGYTNDTCPTLTFNHKMSSIVIDISTPNRSDGTLTLYAIPSIEVDLSTDEVLAYGEAEAIVAAGNGSDSYKAIIAPQSFTSGTLLAKYEFEDEVYEWVADSKLTFASGCRYTFEWDLLEGAVSFKSYIVGWDDTDTPFEISEESTISITAVSQTDLSWEVANGSGVDFSITMIQPTILMENACYEAAKSGLSEEEYVTNILISSDYSCLVDVTYGASTVATYNYGDSHTDYTLYPNANYTIYSLSCTGDYANNNITPLSLNSVDVKTEAFERIGNPYVDVTLKEATYTSLTHTITPNDDAKYWTKLFTQTSEITEYIEYFDGLYGDGAGKARLREYIQQVDPYVLDQSGETELKITIGENYEGIDITRLALGFDANLMPGDEYGESTNQVLGVDQGSEVGTYQVELFDIGATNFTFKATLDPNCCRVYWVFVTPGSYSESDLTTSLAQSLYNEGYVAYRMADDQTEDTTTNVNHDITANYEWFIYGKSENSNYQLLSISENYYGKLSIPVLSEIYTTKSISLGDYEQALTVKAAENGITKTSMLINYDVDKELYEQNGDRVLYHRVIYSDDVFFTIYDTDEKKRDYLIAGDNADLFPVLSQDYAEEDPYSWYYTWKSMEADTEYKYIYCSENGDGVISNLKTTTLKTLDYDDIAVYSNAATSSISSVNNISTNYFDRSLLSPILPERAQSNESNNRRITEEEAAALRANGIPFYTMSDLTRKAILRQQ